jgi:uncharacterized protein YjbI with pentapeptide repeats
VTNTIDFFLRQILIRFCSFLWRTAIASFIFVVMLILTGGNPSGPTVVFVFCFAVMMIIGLEVWKQSGVEIKDGDSLENQLRKRTERRKIFGWYLVQRFSPFAFLFSLSLEGVNLRGTNLKEADLEGANLRGADLRGADLERADLRGANLEGADLEGANLNRADLEGANLNRAYLSKAFLTNASLDKASLRGADLREANLHGANLSNAFLYRANLSEADLREANLHGANLSNAFLYRANLNEAVLSEANLSEANLSEANLSGAYLIRSRFRNNLGLSESNKADMQKRGAIFEDSPESDVPSIVKR